MRLLLDPFRSQPDRLIEAILRPNQSGQMVLLLAASNSNPEIMRLLLEPFRSQPARLSEAMRPDQFGRTALVLAVMNGKLTTLLRGITVYRKPEVIDLLLDILPLQALHEAIQSKSEDFNLGDPIQGQFCEMQRHYNDIILLTRDAPINPNIITAFNDICLNVMNRTALRSLSTLSSQDFSSWPAMCRAIESAIPDAPYRDIFFLRFLAVFAPPKVGAPIEVDHALSCILHLSSIEVLSIPRLEQVNDVLTLALENLPKLIRVSPSLSVSPE